MASEFWSAARRSAMPYVRSLSTTGLSGEAILTFLRDQGIGYRMTDFYSDLSFWRTSDGRRSMISDLPRDSFIPKNLMTESPIDHTMRYKYDFVVTLRDTSTGLMEEQDLSMSHGKWMTPEEAEEAMETEPDWSRSKPDYEFLGCHLVNVLHKQGEPWP
jgi:hypothetical protein